MTRSINGKSQVLTFVQGDGMCAIQDGISRLHIEQVELHGIARVDVLVGVEELAAQQHCFRLVHPLLAERLGWVYPVHCKLHKVR